MAKTTKNAKASELIKVESLVEAIEDTRKEKRVRDLENFGKIVLSSIYANMLEQISGKKLGDIDTIIVNIPFRVQPRFVKEGGEVISGSFNEPDAGTTVEPGAERGWLDKAVDVISGIEFTVDIGGGVKGTKDSRGFEIEAKSPGVQVGMKYREPGSPDAGTPAPSPSPSGGGDVKKKDEPKEKKSKD
jgi:hypothetical protein